MSVCKDRHTCKITMKVIQIAAAGFDDILHDHATSVASRIAMTFSLPYSQLFTFSLYSIFIILSPLQFSCTFFSSSPFQAIFAVIFSTNSNFLILSSCGYFFFFFDSLLRSSMILFFVCVFGTLFLLIFISFFFLCSLSFIQNAIRQKRSSSSQRNKWIESAMECEQICSIPLCDVFLFLSPFSFGAASLLFLSSIFSGCLLLGHFCAHWCDPLLFEDRFVI